MFLFVIYKKIYTLTTNLYFTLKIIAYFYAKYSKKMRIMSCILSIILKEIAYVELRIEYDMSNILNTQKKSAF